MAIHAVFNFWEAWFWIVLGVGTLAVTVCKYRQVRLHPIILFFLLVVFGLSDFVEMRTGAWFRPWWLWGWKAFCVAGMAVMWFVYRKRKM